MTNPADSGDSCVYGSTSGTLVWRAIGKAIVVDVSGVVVDKPRLAEPSKCADDGFYTIAVFRAYSGTDVVAREDAKADNGENQLQFTLGTNSASGLTHLVVQVCREPLFILLPSYCGTAVTYAPIGTTAA
jgi:hypothetical protein